jgi:cytoskeletal protein CcmA (bactofilin family)
MFGRRMEKLKSFLGAESEFKGDFAAKGILRVDGLITGRVQADQVILSETADVKGDIIAKRIVVSGMVEGTLRAPDRVEILPKGRVKGQIVTKKLLIMEGGLFNGQIEMSVSVPNILDFESKNREFSANH